VVGDSARIRVAGIVEDSIVDGPGLRTVFFMQGCDKRCPGCHNPDAQPLGGGTEYTPEELYEVVTANPLCGGVTFSGGEPLLQAAALVPLARMLKMDSPIKSANDGGGAATTDVIPAKAGIHPAVNPAIHPAVDLAVYSGDTLERILARGDKAQLELLSLSDVLIDGPFIIEEKSLALPFRGSKNQRILDSARSVTEGRPVLCADPAWDPKR
jgi:anaerobic ribonucleoside-triphosphate reductase activating protein